MSDLTTFSEHVQDVVRDAYRLPHWTSKEAETYMAQIGVRYQQFEALAHRLNRDLVKPRLDLVARLFPNAKLPEEQLLKNSSCLFEFCDRFPAHAKIDFSIEHDLRFENLIVHTRTRIMPVFVRYSEQDNLTLPWDSIDDAKVADWVEERLLEFLDTYLRIDAGQDDWIEETATDPVCGMPIVRSMAAVSESYYGHPYYFCCEECREKFKKAPKRYIQIKTM